MNISIKFILPLQGDNNLQRKY